MSKQAEIEGMFPETFRELWKETASRADELQEIRLRACRPIILLLNQREFFLDKTGAITKCPEQAYILQDRELQAILNHICKYSVYAYADEMKQGYITIAGGHRIGIAGQVVLEREHEIRSMKYIGSLNIRISHEIMGAADSILPYLYVKGEVQNVLLISPPGCGKTTLLRDLIRQVSDGSRFGAGRTVGVVDERSEIAASYMGKAQNDVGIRTDVLDACPKAEGMLLLIRAMAPRILAVDELGTKEDVQALNQAALSGIGIMATIHGEGIEDIKHKVFLQELLKKRIFKRYIVLGKENGRCTIKGVFNGEFEKCLS